MKKSILSVLAFISLSAWAQGPAARPDKIDSAVWDRVCNHVKSRMALPNIKGDVLKQVNWTETYDGMRSVVDANCKAGYKISEGSPMKGTYDVWYPRCMKIKDSALQLSCIHQFNEHQGLMDAYAEGATMADEQVKRTLPSDCSAGVSTTEPTKIDEVPSRFKENDSREKSHGGLKK